MTSLPIGSRTAVADGACEGAAQRGDPDYKIKDSTKPGGLDLSRRDLDLNQNRDLSLDS
jgi:hypothetical protein